MYKGLIFVLLCFNNILSYSQGEYIVEINRTNGDFEKVGPTIEGVTWILSEERAYDENTSTFFFISADGDRQLYSVSTLDGSAKNYPIISTISSLQFDNSSNKLYALERDNSNDVKYLVSINPNDGSSVRIGDSIPGSAMYSGKFSSLDTINQFYTFRDPTSILYSINLQDGSIVYSPNFILESGEDIINLSYDNSTGNLYALLQVSSPQHYYLVTINPESGLVSKVGPGTTFGSGNATSTIDILNQQYIYLYSSQTEGGTAISTLDLTSGDLVHNSLIQPFDADNFISIVYDNPREKIFSLHWESFPVGLNDDFHNLIRIYSNWANRHAVIEFESLDNKPYTLFIYDSYGNLLHTKEIKQNKTIVEGNNFSSGLYLFVIQSKTRILISRKVIFN